MKNPQVDVSMVLAPLRFRVLDVAQIVFPVRLLSEACEMERVNDLPDSSFVMHIGAAPVFRR